MTTWIALLRAINLAGRNRVAMADLRALVEDLGFQDVRTVLQSGNVVFRGEAAAAGALEAAFEGASRERLGVGTDFFVRSAAEWRGVIAENPWPDEAERDPGHLLVVFLKDAPAEATVEALQDRIQGRETVRARGRRLYAVYPDGVGRSRLTMAAIEKALETRGTGRNWNTVLRLDALAAGA